MLDVLDDDKEVFLGIVDDDDGANGFIMTPNVADELADKLKAAAARVRARHPENVS